VRNFITVRPPASPEAVDAAIEQAFKREAEVDARHVKVEVTDHNAKLYGHVHSMREASAAADGAGPRPRPVHCAAQRLVQADLHVGQRGERCQDGLGTGQRQRDQVGEDGGHGQPGDGLRGRLSSVPDQGQRLGAPYATTRAVAPIGMTLRWVNLGMANAPACRTPARPPSPVRLARCHVPALN
jgi:hypothetical protein